METHSGQEKIPVGCVRPALHRMGASLTETPWTEYPWTETRLYRDLLDGNRAPLTEILLS